MSQGNLVANVFSGNGLTTFNINKYSAYNKADSNYFIMDPPSFIGTTQITDIMISSSNQEILAISGVSLAQLANGKLNITVEDTSVERTNIHFYLYARTAITDVDTSRTM